MDDEALARRDNERREISIETEDGARLMLVQIGTATARQLVCRFAPGKYLEAGAPLGMARIGGIADLVVPAGFEIKVPAVGMSVLAGETIIAGRRRLTIMFDAVFRPMVDRILDPVGRGWPDSGVVRNGHAAGFALGIGGGRCGGVGAALAAALLLSQQAA